ncbi:ParB/RepB/Spo0J family partition protein [Acidobacteriota bacterium]
MPEKRGLPDKSKLSRPGHYLEEFTPRQDVSLGRMIPIDNLVPNPSQPRTDFSELESLSRSIQEKGIIEPLIVRPVSGGKYEIVAGERRYRASLMLDLTELPCIEKTVDEAGSLELSLVENLQRKDLHPFEEAFGLKMLSEKFGYTHEEMARRLGKSRTAITETMGLCNLDKETRLLCLEADISAKSLLTMIQRSPAKETQLQMIEDMAGGRFTRTAAKDRYRISPRRGRPKNYVFRYAPEGQPFVVTIRFRKSDVDIQEVEKALEAALDSIS